MLSFGKKVIISLSVVTAIALNCNAESKNENQKQELTKANTFLEAYSNIAYDVYVDTLTDARALKDAIDKFAKKPTQENLNNAKKAWLNARETYGQSEAFRLSNGPVDSEKGWVGETYGAKEGQLIESKKIVIMFKHLKSFLVKIFFLMR
jgi:putative iron-regulated protein